jgi:hypothetical protein
MKVNTDSGLKPNTFCPTPEWRSPSSRNQFRGERRWTKSPGRRSFPTGESFAGQETVYVMCPSPLCVWLPERAKCDAGPLDIWPHNT